MGVSARSRRAANVAAQGGEAECDIRSVLMLAVMSILVSYVGRSRLRRGVWAAWLFSCGVGSRAEVTPLG